MTPTGSPASPDNQAPPKRTLAVLASIAAIQLDRKAQGLDTRFDAVFDLARELRSTVAIPEASSPHAYLLDPASADLWSKALPTSLSGELRSVPDLAIKAKEVIATLEKPEYEHSKSELRGLRDTCLALSRSAQGQQLHGEIGFPEHPNRR